MQFNKFAGNFQIINGKNHYRQQCFGEDLQITPKGTAGLDSSLDLSLETRLAPQLTSRITGGQIGRFVTDEKGWGVLPLRVKGTFSSPNSGLMSPVSVSNSNRRAEKLEQTIQEKLLKKKEGEPPRPKGNCWRKVCEGYLAMRPKGVTCESHKTVSLIAVMLLIMVGPATAEGNQSEQDSLSAGGLEQSPGKDPRKTKDIDEKGSVRMPAAAVGIVRRRHILSEAKKKFGRQPMAARTAATDAAGGYAGPGTSVP